MNYFNSVDREKNLLFLATSEIAKTYAEESKNINKQEKKELKTAATYLLKVGQSMIKRGSADYQRAILNQSKDTHLILNYEPRQVDGSKFVDSMVLEKDDFLDLADFASRKCRNCKKKHFDECKRYTLFMKLNVPLVEGNTDMCPYGY